MRFFLSVFAVLIATATVLKAQDQDRSMPSKAAPLGVFEPFMGQTLLGRSAGTGGKIVEQMLAFKRLTPRRFSIVTKIIQSSDGQPPVAAGKVSFEVIYDLDPDDPTVIFGVSTYENGKSFKRTDRLFSTRYYRDYQSRSGQKLREMLVPENGGLDLVLVNRDTGTAIPKQHEHLSRASETEIAAFDTHWAQIADTVSASTTVSPAFPPEAFIGDNADVARALAVSAPTGGTPVSPLKRPEEFGLIGRLVGHNFFSLAGTVLRTVSFRAVDRDTVEWRDGEITNVVRRKGKSFVAGLRSDAFLSDKTTFYPASKRPLIIAPNELRFGIERFQLARNGDLLEVIGSSNYQRMYAKLDVEARADIAKRSVKNRQDLAKEVADVNADIARQCSAGATNDDCHDLFKTRDDILALMGQAPPDSQAADFERQRDERVAQRNAAAAAQNSAILGQMMGMVASNFASAQAARMASTQSHVAAPVAARSAPEASVASAQSIPTSISGGQVAVIFGPLPAGTGTPAQRQFWAQRCQNIPNDNSPAAAGCRQTRQSLGASPAQPTTAVAAGGLMQSGSAASRGAGVATGPASVTPVTCVSVAPGKRASLHNGCGFTVLVEYCTTTPQAGSLWQCRQDGGAGLDTISAGADMNTAIAIGNDDYKGGYLLHWAACRGGLGTAEFRPHLTNYGRLADCRK